MRGALHVVVLAAGRGSRLASLGNATPKWLIEAGGRTLADRQLAGFRAADGAVASITVVTGHAAPAIEMEVVRRSEEIRLLHNPQFAELNNWWSLLLALRELPADGPVLVINADLMVDPSHVAGFVHAAAEGEAEGLLAVDLQRELSDEAMKVALSREGTLARIGKVDVVAPEGEYVGMLAARGQALRSLRSALEGFVGRAESSDEWYERAVGDTVAAGAAWHIWPMLSTDWVEIDDDSDLDAANRIAWATV
jgi:choline kinase